MSYKITLEIAEESAANRNIERISATERRPVIKGILDTDILSEVNKAIDSIVTQNAVVYLAFPAQLTFTSTSVYEVAYGLGCKRAARQLSDFLVSIAEHEEIVPDANNYLLAGSIRASLHRAGTPIGSIDPIIAVCAINRDLPLIFGNPRHHSSVRGADYGLALLNWRDANPN